jgi:uridine kinase
LISSIISNIQKISTKTEPLLIAIDGVGGSGKTSLAKYLQNKLKNCFIVQLDDFYSPKIKASDILRIKDQVILPLKNKKEGKFQIYDWKTDKLSDWQTIKPEGKIIIEGVYAMDKQIISYYDVKIWIEYPPELGFKRGVSRDITGDGVDNSEKWIKDWMPLEKQYIIDQNPKSKADYIIDGNEIA